MGWDGNDGMKGPWGSGSNTPPPRNGGSSGGGGRGKPPKHDIDDFIRKGQERMKDYMPGSGNNRGFVLLALAAALLWVGFNSYYIVAPDEQGVVLRFGAYHRTTPPGFHLKLPPPFETAMIPQVTRVNRIEIGFRSGSTNMAGDSARSIPRESLMLTGDENIVDIHFEVQWKIRDAEKFLFNTRNPQIAVKDAAESAMREVMGKNPITNALTEKKLEMELTAKSLLQDILDSYNAGIEIILVQMLKVDPPEAVIDAFRDVQTAKADLERSINEAQSYRNDIIPKARGQAEQMLQEAEAYKQKVTAQAQGEAARFVSVYDEYKNAKDVTKKRMYLEMMESTLAGMEKIIIDKTAGSGVVPYLPLPELQKKNRSSE